MFNVIHFVCDHIHVDLSIVLMSTETQRASDDLPLTPLDGSQTTQRRYHIAVLVLSAEFLQHQRALVKHSV